MRLFSNKKASKEGSLEKKNKQVFLCRTTKMSPLRDPFTVFSSFIVRAYFDFVKKKKIGKLLDQMFSKIFFHSPIPNAYDIYEKNGYHKPFLRIYSFSNICIKYLSTCIVLGSILGIRDISEN